MRDKFVDGRSARALRQPRDDNPYHPDREPQAHRWWDRGWVSGGTPGRAAISSRPLAQMQQKGSFYDPHSR